jgi:hypothetical protein
MRVCLCCARNKSPNHRILHLSSRVIGRDTLRLRKLAGLTGVLCSFGLSTRPPPRSRRRMIMRYSVYLLYWYNSKNTDATRPHAVADE